MKVLFIDSTHNIILDELGKAGFTCDYLPDAPADNILEILPKYDGVIIRSRIKFTKEVIDKADNLKFIGRVGAGMESIDVEYAESKGIKCFNSPEGNRVAVGEHALGMLLMLFNKLNYANSEVKTGEWLREKNRGVEVSGKTVGIIGYGNMGSAFAQRLKGFDVEIIAYDKYKTGFGNEYVKEVSLQEVFDKADILSLHVPLTEETKFMINETFINSFKNPFYLINTARGPVVKTTDLISSINNKRISGAVLDVLEYEESSFEKIDLKTNENFKALAGFDNVLLSPHVAGWTVESKVKLAKVLADKIINEFA